MPVCFFQQLIILRKRGISRNYGPKMAGATEAVLVFIVCMSAVVGLELNPNVKEFHVLEGESQEVDCSQTVTGGTAELRWTGPRRASYTVTNRNGPNQDGSFTFHHVLTFLSFRSDDEGIYTCTLRTQSLSYEQFQIRLIFQKDCDDGKYGKQCNYSCPENCEIGNESPCDEVYGSCVFGCRSGYMGPKCTTECIYGTYGKSCLYNCSENCKIGGRESPCSPQNGFCKFGCMQDYTGLDCSKESSGGQGAPILIASVVAVIVPVIIVLILISLFWFKRVRKKGRGFANAGVSNIHNPQDDQSDVEEGPSQKIALVDIGEHHRKDSGAGQDDHTHAEKV